MAKGLSRAKKNTPEKTIAEFLLSKSNAENAVSLWLDGIGAISMEKGDLAEIDSYDNKTQALYITIRRFK